MVKSLKGFNATFVDISEVESAIDRIKSIDLIRTNFNNLSALE